MAAYCSLQEFELLPVFEMSMHDQVMLDTQALYKRQKSFQAYIWSIMHVSALHSGMNNHVLALK